MGYRTVVVLNNDAAHEWMNDPNLGKLIVKASSFHEGGDIKGGGYRNYGEVVQCVHADNNSLVEVANYSGKIVAAGHWHHNETPETRKLELLKRFADSMGYTIRKKAKK